MTFAICVDITVSKVITAHANNEAEARKYFEEAFNNDPLYYAKTCDAVLSHEVTDVYEEKEDCL